MLQGFTRARRGRVSLAAGAALALVVLSASPASAHQVGLGGGAVCQEGDHLIIWGIGNSQPAQAMTITSATATLDGTDYGVSGHTSPVAGGSFTLGATVVPGAMTGTVTLEVSVFWDETFSDTGTHSVTLEAPCPSTTTTTTSTTTSTSSSTTSTTSTTVPTSTTATTVVVTGTTTPTGATTTTLAATSQGASTPTSAAGGTLPRTGGSGTAAWLGLAVLAAGAVALVLVPYRPLRKHAPRAK